MRFGALVIAGICSVVAPMAAASEVALGVKGWEIATPELGKVTVSYPRIGPRGALAAPGDAVVEGKTARLSYDTGARLAVEQSSPGVYRLHFTSVPAGTESLKIESTLPQAVKGKASWSVDGRPAELFAASYGGKPFVFQGDAKRFAVKDSRGDGFAFITEYGYQQLQDNREWNTDSFGWFSQADMPSAGGGEAYMTIRIASTFDGEVAMPAAAPAAQAAPAPAPAAPAAQDRTIAKPKFTLSERGVVIDAGVAGRMTMGVPALSGVKAAATGITVAEDGKSLTYVFAGGGRGQVVLSSADTVTMSFSELPAGANGLRMDTHIAINYSEGGTWAVDANGAKAFPKDKATPPHLYQGNAERFTLLHPTGAGFTMSGFPAGTYHQLQDNREWNWPIYAWWFNVPVTGGAATASLTLKLEAPIGGAAEVKAMIDRFGQHVAKDFSEKVRSDEELLSDVEADRAYYSSLQPPAVDKFGGLPGSGEKLGLKKTGFFHIQKIETARGPVQLLVNPEGNAFFQLGVCTLGNPCDDYTTVRGRESIYEWLPKQSDPLFGSAYRDRDPGVFSYYLSNRVRKFGKPFEHGPFFAETVDRIRKWGFNSAGAFTGFPEPVMKVAQEQSLPYVTFLPTGRLNKFEICTRVWDPFQPDIEQLMDESFAGLARRANDPLIIGYFLVNEPLLEDVPKVVPTLKASKSPSKGRLVQMLEEKYATIAAFNAAWSASAASFEELKEQPLVVGTKTAAEDMHAFYELFLERRYRLVNEYFRKYDPNHLLIGDRWMPGTANSEALVRTAGKYFDVISINYYAYGIERDFLDRVYQWSGGRPMLFSEFYFACRDQGLSGGGRQMNSQEERGLAYRNYVEQSAATGYVVGVQWFSHLDQAATGRFFEGFNGEAANIGLVNVADRPYKAFLAEAMKTNYDIYSVVLREREPFSYADPRFQKTGGGRKTMAINRITKPVVLDGQRDEWPAFPPARVGVDGLVLGADSNGLEATFRLGWDDKNLYLYAEVNDTTPMENSASNAGIWAQDSIELFTGFDNLDAGGSLQFGDRQILIRGAKSGGELAAVHFVNAPRPYTAQATVIPGIDGKSYIIEAAIPFEALGFVPKAGQEILFDLCVNDGHAGARRQLAWNGTSQNSKNRGVWGKAEFTN